MTKRAPDWKPKRSATDLPEGVLMFGSTGQLWQVRDRQWIRASSWDDGYERGRAEALEEAARELERLWRSLSAGAAAIRALEERKS